MTLSTRAMAWHGVSLTAGAMAMLTVMSSKQIDVYALFDQLNVTVAALTKLFSMIGSAAVIIGAAYRTFNSKQVPVDTLALRPIGNIPADVNTHVTVSGMMIDGTPIRGAAKIVGALLLALILFAPHGASAQQTLSTFANSCDPATIFKNITPQNFLARFKQCGDDDIKSAIADAQSEPIDNAALACLLPVQKIKAAINTGGLLTAFQGFRRARQNGLVTGCINYINSTIGNF